MNSYIHFIKELKQNISQSRHELLARLLIMNNYSFTWKQEKCFQIRSKLRNGVLKYWSYITWSATRIPGIKGFFCSVRSEDENNISEAFLCLVRCKVEPFNWPNQQRRGNLSAISLIVSNQLNIEQLTELIFRYTLFASFPFYEGKGLAGALILVINEAGFLSITTLINNSQYSISKANHHAWTNSAI